jgi:hypothetical protein
LPNGSPPSPSRTSPPSARRWRACGRTGTRGELTERLAQEFARLPGVPTEQQARALALYLACLRARLLADENLRPVVVALSTLRTEAGVERLLEAVDALYGAVNRLLGLPADLVAWPVQTLSEIAELRADLLLPAYRLVPYTGRAFQETRADLLAWARGLEAARPPVGLRTYIGPGGAGKTRLLIEVGQALRQEGWWVGFLRAGRLKEENARILSTDARPTLLIVDYIANRDREVRILLHEAARACGERAAPLAVVLLERTFPDWLREDLHTYTDPEYVGWPAFLGLPTVEKEPRHLPDLAPDDRRMLFRTAREQFAKILRADGRPLPDYADLPDAPLYVLLLALLAAAGERVERPTDPEQVLECTWSRERAAWKRHLEPLFRNQPEARLNRAVEVVEDLAVLATLGRAFADPPAAAAFLKAHEPHFRPIPGVTWDELADRLPVLFPRRVPGSLIPPVAPDPLADFVLRRRLAERADLVPLALPGPEEAEAEAEEAVRAAGEALGVLARLWERAPDEQGRQQAAGWMRAAAERLAAWPASAWDSLRRALPVPDRTLALRPFLADFYRARRERLSPEAAEERAGVLVMLGWALSALGRREEALAATQEAADLYRDLARQNPQAFLPDLAMSLNNLGKMLSDLGRREEALAATQEAVEIRRDLAQANPQAFLPDLAGSLNNLGRDALRPGPAGGGAGGDAGGGGHLPQTGRTEPPGLPPRPGDEPQQPGHYALRPGPAGGGADGDAGGGGHLPQTGRTEPPGLPPRPGREPQQPGPRSLRPGPAGGGAHLHAGGGRPLPRPGPGQPPGLPPRPGDQPQQPGQCTSPSWAGGRRRWRRRRRPWTSTATWPRPTPRPSSPTWR